MMNDLFVPVVLGTGRVDRESEKAAKFVYGEVGKSRVKTQLVDVRDYALIATIPSWVKDDKVEPWREIANKADGFVFVVPEYNRGYPGELKILIDQAKDEYKYKPVVVCGVSSGGFGGARVIENLLGVWVTLQMIPIKSSVFFSGVEDLFEDNGVLKDQSYVERVALMMEELIWLTETMKQAKK